MKSLVCIFAHPDDEAMGPGGTIAKFAQEREVYLLCVTNGNASDGSKSSDLAKRRQDELLKSAEILGIKKVDFLGFDDGELNNNLYHKVAEKIKEKLLVYQPDTLLTFDTKGVTGHLDHIAVSLITSFVFKKLDFVKTLLYYCETKEMVAESFGNYFIFAPAGYDPLDIPMKVDISGFLEQKKMAISAHASQRNDVEQLLSLLEKEQRKIEYFQKLEK